MLCASSSLPLPFGRHCTSKVAQKDYHSDERELCIYNTPMCYVYSNVLLAPPLWQGTPHWAVNFSFYTAALSFL